MIDIDKYLDTCIDIKLKGEVYEIKQPSSGMTRKLTAMSKEINEDNYLDKKSEILLMLINNNKNGKVFTYKDIDEIPYKVQDIIINKIVEMVTEADNDPN